MRKKRISWV